MKRINVRSYKGCYNLLNPNEESISTTIQVMNKEKIELYCTIRTDYVFDDPGPYECINEIDNYLKKMLYVSDKNEILKVRDFINQYAEELEDGNNINSYCQVKEQRKKLDSKLDYLYKKIGHLLENKDKEEVQK